MKEIRASGGGCEVQPWKTSGPGFRVDVAALITRRWSSTPFFLLTLL